LWFGGGVGARGGDEDVWYGLAGDVEPEAATALEMDVLCARKAARKFGKLAKKGRLVDIFEEGFVLVVVVRL
jgi:hypothetical protein